jgi:hypothetical protein
VSSIGNKFTAAKDYITSSHQAYKADAEWAHAVDRNDPLGAAAAQDRFNTALENVEDAKARWNGETQS